MEIEGAAIGTLFARLFEFAVIVGYFFTRDSKIQYRVQDLRMKCTSLLHEYIMISVPVFVSDGLLALGTTAVAMIMGRISKEFVSANSITFCNTTAINGINSRNLPCRLYCDGSYTWKKVTQERHRNRHGLF